MDKSKTYIKRMFDEWKNDYIFKTVAGSFFSFMITVVFALYNGFLGIYIRSIWNESMCIFYLLLALTRGLILLFGKKSKGRGSGKKPYSRYGIFIISTVMLLVFNIAVIFPIYLMVMFRKPVNMGLIPAIGMAAYTTYKITMSVIHIFVQKRRGNNNIFIEELRTINFIDALVSILTLQNTLIMVKMEHVTERMLSLCAVSSGVIYIIIVSITIRLLVSGIRRHKTEPEIFGEI